MADSKKNKKKWGVEKRLEFIDFRLYWEGRLNRGDLCGYFGVSIPQASGDIAQYLKLAPGNMVYTRKEKYYFPSDTFKPALIKPNADLYLSQLHSLSGGLIEKENTFIRYIPEYTVLGSFKQSVKPETLKVILAAMKNNKAIEINYQSLSRPEPIWRWISPHGLASDQFRWHMRAFCHNRFEFRDFVLTRILDVRGENPSYTNPEDDKLWHTQVTVKIGPHPDLPDAQKKIIELDYGMTDGIAEIQVRASLLFYFMQQHGFMEDEQVNRPPHIQQVVLLNRDDVMKSLKQEPQ